MQAPETMQILEIQNDFFRKIRMEAGTLLKNQATVSKRDLLTFVTATYNFCEQFVALNEKTINELKEQTNGQENQNRQQLGIVGANQVRNLATGEIIGGKASDS